MTERTTSLLPWIVGAGSLTLLALALVLSILNGSDEDLFTIVIAIVMVLGYTTLGAMAAAREPRNPTGWLLMSIALGMVLSAASEEWFRYTSVTSPGSLPLRVFMGWLTGWSGFIMLASIPLLLFTFPTGHLPSPRWRWVVRATMGAIALGWLAGILKPGPIDHGYAAITNPTGVESLRKVVEVAQTASLLGLVGGLAAVVSLVLRYRQADGDERQQIKWVAYAGTLGAFFLTALVAIGPGEDEQSLAVTIFFFGLVLCLGVAIPAACGIAILKYRLYDLDLVIKKTVVFGILVVLMMAAGLFVLLILSNPLAAIAPDETLAVGLAGVIIGSLVWPMWRVSRRVADRVVYGGRSSPYEILTAFSGRVAETYSSEDVLSRMATVLGEGTGAEQATVWLSVDGEPRLATVWPPGSDVPGALAEDAVWVVHQGDPLGALAVRMPPSDPMGPSKLRLVEDLAAQAGPVLRNVRLIEDLRDSRKRLVAAQDEERRKLERNIHDGAQQQLVALTVKLRLAEQLAERDVTRTREMLGQLQDEATAALEDLRDLARGIYPPLLADKGLAAALQAQARKAAVPTTVEADAVARYPQDVEAAVYFSCLEALQNVAKYADASRTSVHLAQTNGSLAFTVSDDGRGFDTAATTHGTGLQGMADRLEAIGGSLRVRSEPGRGTSVSGQVPLG